jgi:hypothetical protein
MLRSIKEDRGGAWNRIVVAAKWFGVEVRGSAWRDFISAAASKAR